MVREAVTTAPGWGLSRLRKLSSAPDTVPTATDTSSPPQTQQESQTVADSASQRRRKRLSAALDFVARAPRTASADATSPSMSSAPGDDPASADESAIADNSDENAASRSATRTGAGAPNAARSMAQPAVSAPAAQRSTTKRYSSPIFGFSIGASANRSYPKVPQQQDAVAEQQPNASSPSASATSIQDARPVRANDDLRILAGRKAVEENAKTAGKTSGHRGIGALFSRNTVTPEIVLQNDPNSPVFESPPPIPSPTNSKESSKQRKKSASVPVPSPTQSQAAAKMSSIINLNVESSALSRSRRPSSDHKTALQLDLENKLRERTENGTSDATAGGHKQSTGIHDLLERGPPELYQPKSKPKPSLILQTAFQEKDILSEFLELQRGVGYYAKPVGNTQALLGGHERLFVRINLLGIHISLESGSQPLVEFAIEHVMTFSHNRSKQTFTFSYLHSDGLLNEYKFFSDKYFEIFEALGSAISIVISMKEKQVAEENAGRRIAAESLASGMNGNTTSSEPDDVGAISRKDSTAISRMSFHHDDGTNLQLPEAELKPQEQKQLNDAIQEQNIRRLQSQKRERRKSFMPVELTRNGSNNSSKSSSTNSVSQIGESSVYQQQIGQDPESRAAYETLSGSPNIGRSSKRESKNLDVKINTDVKMIARSPTINKDRQAVSAIPTIEQQKLQQDELNRRLDKSEKKAGFRKLFASRKTKKSTIGSPASQQTDTQDVQSPDSGVEAASIGDKDQQRAGIENKTVMKKHLQEESTRSVESEASHIVSADTVKQSRRQRPVSEIIYARDGELAASMDPEAERASKKALFAKFYLETRFKQTENQTRKSGEIATPQKESKQEQKQQQVKENKKDIEDGNASRRWKTKKRFDYIQTAEEQKVKQPSDEQNQSIEAQPFTNDADVSPKKRNRLSLFRIGHASTNSEPLASLVPKSETPASSEPVAQTSDAVASNGSVNKTDAASNVNIGDPNCVLLSPADTLSSPLKESISPIEQEKLFASSMPSPVGRGRKEATTGKGTWMRKGNRSASKETDIRDMLSRPPASSPPTIPMTVSKTTDGRVEDVEIPRKMSVMQIFNNRSRATSSNAVKSASPVTDGKHGDELALPNSEHNQQSSSEQHLGDGSKAFDVDNQAKYSTLKKMTSGFNTIMRPRKRGGIPKISSSGEALDQLADGKPSGPQVEKVEDEEGNVILITVQKADLAEITAGTVDALISALCGIPDLAYVEVFLLTFRHFTTPEMLMQKLTQLYNEAEISSRNEKTGTVRGSPLSAPGTEPAMLICHRIVSLVKKWVGEHTYDFLEPRTMEVLNEFLDLVKSGSYYNYADQIKRILSNELESLDAKKSDILLAFSSLERSETMALLQIVDILSVSAKKIAQQLTIVDSKLFRGIRPEEFAVMLWGGGTRDIRAQRLQAYIDRFNTIGYWTATSICTEENRQRRVAVMEKFIRIACRCFEIQNFNSSMAILSGLNTTPVLRLQKTRAAMSSRLTSMLEDLEAKLSYKSNYKAYREIEHLSKPPMIPFFGLIIKDLTFMNDGNPKCLPNGLINFEKQRLISNYIQTIRESQRYVFPFHPENEPLRTSIRPPIDNTFNNSARSLSEKDGASAAANAAASAIVAATAASAASSGPAATTNRTIGAGETNLYIYCCRPPCLLEDEIMEYSHKCESSQLQQNRLHQASSVMAISHSATEADKSADSTSSQPQRLVSSVSEPALAAIEDGDELGTSLPRSNSTRSVEMQTGSNQQAESVDSVQAVPVSEENKQPLSVAEVITVGRIKSPQGVYDDDRDD